MDESKTRGSVNCTSAAQVMLTAAEVLSRPHELLKVREGAPFLRVRTDDESTKPFSNTTRSRQDLRFAERCKRALCLSRLPWRVRYVVSLCCALRAAVRPLRIRRNPPRCRRCARGRITGCAMPVAVTAIARRLSARRREGVRGRAVAHRRAAAFTGCRKAEALPAVGSGADHESRRNLPIALDRPVPQASGSRWGIESMCQNCPSRPMVQNRFFLNPW
jgi:hypothetical protein